MPGGRAAFGLRVALAPLSGRVAPSRQVVRGMNGRARTLNRFHFLKLKLIASPNLSAALEDLEKRFPPVHDGLNSPVMSLGEQ